MALLWPKYTVAKATNLTPRLLKQLGFEGLLLDVDNTLTTHNNPEPYEGVLEWLLSLKEAGVKLQIVSNNHSPRVEPFARRLGIDYTANAKKPLPGGFLQGLTDMGLEKTKAAAVGDQLFTDILGGNLAGIPTILVTGITPETGWFFRIKRWLEKSVIKRYQTSGREISL